MHLNKIAKEWGDKVEFDNLVIHQVYERPFLAKLWGYKSWHAIGRGVVTPRGQSRIVLFVTRIKQKSLVQYSDYLDKNRLYMDGERNHQTI